MANAFYENHFQITQSKPYIFHKDSGGCPPHWHENVEILLFHTAAKVYSDQEFYEILPGDIVIINSDAVHTIPPTIGLYYDCLIADSRYCTENGIDLTEINFRAVVRDEIAVKLFKNVVAESDKKSEFSETAIRASMLSLLVYLCRSCSTGLRRSNGSSFIKRAIKYIDNRPGEHISVNDIANHVNMSKYHFCREFKKETGYTVVGYINLTRCLKAKKLLSSGEYTVAEVAAECGFENKSYFSKTFKNVIGILPASYKKHRNN